MREVLVVSSGSRPLRCYDAATLGMLCEGEAFLAGAGRVCARLNLYVSLHQTKPLFRVYALDQLGESKMRTTVPEWPSAFDVTENLLVTGHAKGTLMAWALKTGALQTTLVLPHVAPVTRIVVADHLVFVTAGTCCYVYALSVFLHTHTGGAAQTGGAAAQTGGTAAQTELAVKTSEASPLASYQARDAVLSMALVDSDSRGPLVVLGDSSGRVVLWRPGADTEEFVLDLLRPVPSLLIVGRSRLLVATGRKLLEFDLYTCVHQYLQNDRVPLVREMLKADIWNQPDTAAGNARMDGDAQASEGVHTSEGVQIGDIKTMLVNEGQTLLAGVVDQSLVVWDVLTRAVKYVNVNEQIYSVQFALNKPTLKNLCDDAMPARLPTSNPQLFVPPQLQTTACVTGMHRQHVFAEPEALTKLFDAYIESSLYVSRKRPLDLPRDQQFAVNAVIQLEMKSTQLSQDQAMKENKLQRLTTFFKALDRRPVCPPVDRHQPGTDTSHLLRLMYQSVNPLLPGPVKRPSKFKQTKTAYFVPPASWTKQ